MLLKLLVAITGLVLGLLLAILVGGQNNEIARLHHQLEELGPAAESRVSAAEGTYAVQRYLEDEISRIAEASMQRDEYVGAVRQQYLRAVDSLVETYEGPSQCIPGKFYSPQGGDSTSVIDLTICAMGSTLVIEGDLLPPSAVGMGDMP
jgi:hypothetical protein